MRGLAAAALLAGLTGTAAAQTVTVTHPWARATPPHAATAAVYLTLTSTHPDRLLGAETPAAATAEPHSMDMTGGIMRMRPVAGGVTLPAHTAVTLAPGGTHLMLSGLAGPLVAGAEFPLTLRFAHAAPLTVRVQVAGIGADAMDGMDMAAPRR